LQFGVRSLRLQDHSEAESAVDGVEPLVVDRLSLGTATAEFVQIELGDVAVVAGDYGSPIHSRGLVRSDQALVGLQMAPSPGHWNGRSFRQDAAWIYGAGAEHDGVGLEPTYFAAVGVPAPLADALRGDPVAAGQVQLSTGPHAESLRVLLADLVDLARTTATRSQQLEPQVAAPARAALIDRLAVTLRLGHGAERLDRGAAARVVHSCLQAADHLGPQPSPLDLGAALGLTDRRIRAAFNEWFGVPVATYFRHRALHAAHRDLVHARSGETTVAAVAIRWGFWHLGRFAQRYRHQFGVPPSVTLTATKSRT
jgi:AraC family ethanolamine operon transcriptional activator